jgi:phosphopentomutase
MITGAAIRSNVNIGTRDTFADLGQTVAELLGVGPLPKGASFLRNILS